jgi:hypothetical protein
MVKAATSATRPHRKGCDGHIDCPNCGDCCARITLWEERPGPAIPGTRRRTKQWRPLRVACLGCGAAFYIDPRPKRRESGAEPCSHRRP